MCAWFGGPWAGGSMFMMLPMLFFWFLLIWGAVTLFRRLTPPRTADREPDPAMNILKERYAKGELSKEDFERMKKDLE